MRYEPRWVLVLGILTAAGAVEPAAAQTDFYNLDKHRPLRVEDAYATKRWAFEIKGSPLTLAQSREGTLRYVPSLELKHGILPGVELSAGTNFDVSRDAGETRSGFGEVELSTLANLWVESDKLPAVGVRLTGHLPMEREDAASLEVRALATRGLTGPLRAHATAAWLAGRGAHEEWWAGVALDWVFPFHHTLLLAEGWVTDVGEGTRTVHTGFGARYQISPTLALDAGVGRDWNGAERRDWAVTLGITHEFAVRALMPGPGRSGGSTR